MTIRLKSIMIFKGRFVPWWYLISVISMFTGGMIYIMWRPYSLKMFEWFSDIGLDGCIKQIRIYLYDKHTLFPSQIIYSLPQALWCLSGFFFVHGTWRSIRSFEEQIWLGIILSIGLSFEILQFFGILPGIFDFVDVLWICVFYILSQFLFWSTQLKRKVAK